MKSFKSISDHFALVNVVECIQRLRKSTPITPLTTKSASHPSFGWFCYLILSYWRHSHLKMPIYSIFKGCKDRNILKTLIFPEVQPEGTASLIKGHKVCRQTEKLIWPFKVKWELFDRRFLSVLIRKCNLIWRKTLATVTVLKCILHASAQISKKCGGGTKLSLLFAEGT